MNEAKRIEWLENVIIGEIIDRMEESRWSEAAALLDNADLSGDALQRLYEDAGSGCQEFLRDECGLEGLVKS